MLRGVLTGVFGRLDMRRAATQHQFASRETRLGKVALRSVIGLSAYRVVG